MKSALHLVRAPASKLETVDEGWFRWAPIEPRARFGRLTVKTVTAERVDVLCDCGERSVAHVAAMRRGSVLQCWKCSAAMITLTEQQFRLDCALAFSAGSAPPAALAPGADFARIAGVLISGAELRELLDLAPKAKLTIAAQSSALLNEGMKLRRQQNLSKGLCGCGGTRLKGERRCAKCKERHDRGNAKPYR